MKISDRITIKEIPALVLTDEQKQRCEGWVAALRSGTYSQAFGSLRTPEGFCCLGVACDLMDDTKWQGEYKQGAMAFKDGVFSGIAAMVPTIQEYYGLGELGFAVIVSIDCSGEFGGQSVTLAHLNDVKVPFSQIADIIELAINGGYKYKE